MKLSLIKVLLFTAIAIFGSSNILAQGTSGVKWYTIEEAEKLIKTAPRPIFVDTYTDWCSWCVKLDKETFSHPVIVNILNTKFYAVKFDAEGKDDVVFKGTTFKNDGKSGKTHQLAVALLQGKMSYPSVVFMNENAELLTVVPGFMQAPEIEPILMFFADKAYLNQTYEVFSQGFKSNIK